MSKSEIALLCLNIVVLMMSMVGLAAQHTEPMSIALILAVAAVLASSAKLIRRGSPPDRAARRRSRRGDLDDEMDPRTVLDIDARLEALERREREIDDAVRIQALAARGQQGALSEPLADEFDPQPRRERA